MFVADTNHLRAERSLSAHPLYARQREFVHDFVVDLRAARTPEDFRALHMRLLVDFIGSQRFLEQLGEEKDELRSAIAAAKAARDEPELRAGSQRIKQNDLDAKAANAILSLDRVMGDALAWILVSFNRGALTILGEGVRVERLADVAGLSAELAEIDRLWASDQTLAIHTDLTTCLQHGDLLVFTSWEPREFETKEIKAGRSPSPGSSQSQRNERVRILLAEKAHPTGAHGDPLSLTQSSVPLATNVGQLPALLDEARRASYTSRLLEPGLLAEIYDETNPAGLSQEEFDRRHVESVSAVSEEKDLIRYSFSYRRLRDRRHSFSSLAPVSLLPLSTGDVADLVHGRFDVIVTLDIASLEDLLAEHEISAAVARPADDAGNRFMTVVRGSVRIEVPAPVREQVLLEFMTFDTLVRQIEWMLDEVEQHGTDQRVLSYAGEAEYWTTYLG